MKEFGWKILNSLLAKALLILIKNITMEKFILLIFLGTERNYPFILNYYEIES